ncbi:Dynein heavy chain, cytoplasmic [Tritrichomonas foetus]|uniref:Dynein heavy chain, cytoplasmic n=1 Tax=Tritrichomonas foetus TaxID=1144522 RepID=A0A1J4K638_9EUKA|nr:Dynein heavy chain, cytoplasmic [Tritrichomonas foetus]|eukprot:OHT04933.1 Dynein heavy chain, cytoplasmic [Tritrichomonas foetus]
MSLSPDELVQYLSPTLISLFGKSSIDNLAEEYQSVLKDFIENPSKTLLLARKAETVIFQTTFEATSGPILLCQKAPQALPNTNFQSLLSVFSLPAESVLSFLQSLIGQFFLPYFQTSISSDDNLAKGVIESLSTFEIAINRFHHKTQLPEPVLDISDELYSISSDQKLDIAQENDLLNKTDKWISTVRSVISIAQQPPKFTLLQDEINFWPELAKHLSLVKQQTDRLTASKLPEIVGKYRKVFPDHLNQVIADTPKLIEQIDPFAAAISQFNTEIYNSCDKIEVFIENLKNTYNFLKPFLSTCSQQQRIPEIYSLTNEFLLSNFSSVLTKIAFVHLPPSNFETTMNTVNLLIDCWASQEKEMLESLKNISFQIKTEIKAVITEKDKYFERIMEFAEAKNDVNHIIAHLQSHEEIDAGELQAGINQAFSVLMNSSFLGMTPDASLRWSANLMDFRSRLEKIEYDIAQSLSVLLTKCKTLNETRDVFVEHKILCKRPTIQALLRQFEQPFIMQINEQLEIFRKKELVNITKLPIIIYLQAKGVTSDAAKLLHVRHVGEQLKVFESMIKDVVGERWRDANECQQLIPVLDACHEIVAKTSDIKKLITNVFLSQDDVLTKYLFTIEEKDHEKHLKCDYSQFNLNSINTFRSLNQFRLVKDMDAVTNMMQLKKSYRFYARVQESLTNFVVTLKTIDPTLKQIAADQITSIYQLIKNGWNKRWNSQDVSKYTKDFSKAISAFNTSITQASQVLTAINENLAKFEKAQTSEDLAEVIADTLSKVDQLFCSKLTNDEAFVADLNQRIATILTMKVLQTCNIWIDALTNKTKLPIDQIILRVSNISNHIIVQPPFALLHPIINRCFTSQIDNYLLQNQIYTMNSTKMSSFQEIVAVPHDEINKIFLLISQLCGEIELYIDQWMANEILFTSEPQSVDFASDIAQWVDLIQGLDAQLKTIKTYPPKKTIGIVTIDTSLVQKSVIDRIGKWQEYALAELTNNAKSLVNKLFDEVAKARTTLEAPIPTKARELASYLTTFRQSSALKANWDGVLPSLELSQKYCTVDDYAKLTSCIESFNQIYTSRNREIESNNKALCAQVERESASVLKATEGLKAKWDADKPLNGDTIPANALKLLESYKGRFAKVQVIWKELVDAREALHLTMTPNTVLEAMIDDCEAMTEVWNLLSGIWSKLHNITSVIFANLTPSDTKAKLGGLVEKLNQMSNTVRQYEAWSYYSQKLKTILKVFPKIEGLKSPAVLPRHWQHISQQFKKRFDLATMTLADILAIDLQKNEYFFDEIIRNAQGEFSLHQYLDQLDQIWNSLEFEFSDYKGKMNLIKSWDVILTTISDHLNSLSTMQTSPFFHVFREQATSWENRLNQLQVLLDEWLDVQRRFIYLEGVFNSPDIRTILGKATANFKKAEKEFATLTKRAAQLKVVMKVTTIPNIGTTLQQLNESLLLLQKELSDYLEKQRSFFPRFFFIGDEDLLEIIGKSSAISEIQRHFGKMFEGLSGVSVNDNSVVAMNCSEGESVPFGKSVSISNAIYQTLSDIEKEMRNSLKQQLLTAAGKFEEFWTNMSLEKLKAFIEEYPAQIVLLSFFVVSTAMTEKHIDKSNIPSAVQEIIQFISFLSQLVFTNLSVASRHTVQQLITECVHHRNLTRELEGINSITAFEWTHFLRFYHDKSNGELLAKIGDASFSYGFEYLGLTPSLVRTPLTDRVYLTMAQALFAKMGGSPFGPAGTGKTETVKNMGHHLGRHVLVFNCDETFDFKAMGRIFVGLCHCGSWGCFDEFNRLDEQMLSAVSQQIQTIQSGLKANQPNITILGKKAPLNQSIGIFITMNPGYAGRVELPDNLKQLFRTMAMNRPDTELIAEVLLFSQGFSSAEMLAPKFVALFSMAKESLSYQTHYDFGLRAMKAVLTNAGQLIRQKVIQPDENRELVESKLLISSIVNTLFPKLLSHDLARLQRLIDDVFPGVKPEQITQEELLTLLHSEAEAAGWIDSEIWVNKIIQLFYIQQITHGFMLVGPSATGKTSARTILLKVLSLIDKQESESYVINPKSVTKDTLFGALDPVTREWTDGVFTRILRTIVDNQRGEMSKRHWIVFDGDVDPEWVENLNSVLDDNKLLTLPNGERISLPPNVRIVFEVENLNFATPATVSRCGIVFFSQNTLKFDEIVKYHIHSLMHEPIITPTHVMFNEYIDIPQPDMIEMQRKFSEIASPTLYDALEVCSSFWKANLKNAVMEIPPASCISTLFALLSASFVHSFRQQQPSELLLQKATLFATYWAFALPFNNEYRQKLDAMFREDPRFAPIIPSSSLSKNVVSEEIEDWQPVEEFQFERGTDDFVPTPSTEIARKIVQMSTIGDHTVVLCGPNGVGKQSILQASLGLFTEMNTVRLNFSNCSSIDFVLQTLEHNCVYIKSSTATKLKPKAANTFLVFECVNLNLPALDKYGTQRVVEFLRQLLELKGFWHPHRREWIQLELISFAGLCSPPTYYGRVKLSTRFLRYASVIYYEHPPVDAVRPIIRSLLANSGCSSQDEVCDIACEFYQEFRDHFKGSEKVHYTANMRDLVGWINSFVFALETSKGLDIAHLLYNEGLRIFADRLSEIVEREWVQETLQSTVLKHLSDSDSALFQTPYSYTRLLTESYIPSELDKIRPQLELKLKAYEEENNGSGLVFFDECIELITHIERRLAVPGGHTLLVGLSGTGKALLPSFVAWYREMPVFRLRVHKEYTLNDFDSDLRKILKAALEESVCFIIKDTDIILPVFTERLNVLLAESTIPGLFAGDELASLLAATKDAARIAGQLLDTEDSIFNYFLERVKANLHIIYTTNSATVDMNQTDIMFPSLVSLCGIIWVGTWSDSSLTSFTSKVLQTHELTGEENQYEAMLKIHHAAVETSASLPVTNYVSPRFYFDFVNQFCHIFTTKRQKLNTEQQHLSNGLSKLEETQVEVSRMGEQLKIKQEQLKEKTKLVEDKMQEILKDNQATVSKNEEAQKIKVILDEKRKVIDADKADAMAELAEVTPQIEEAKSSVSNIKKSNLDEIRRLQQPPDVIKYTLSAVLILLGQQTDNWAAIRKVISGDQFIKQVIDFKIDSIPPATIKKVQTLIDNNGLTLEKAQRASQACGPLFKWLNANLKYLVIIERTEPLRQRVEALEKEASVFQKQHDDLSKTIRQFKRKLTQLQNEYNVLVSECNKAQKESEQISVKLERATHLLSSLTNETKRWQERQAGFQTQRANLLGHSLLSAAFVAYTGFLEQQRRMDAIIAWEATLSECNIKYDEEFQFCDFMADPEQLMDWTSKELPNDDLCVQNAVILATQDKRAPFIIDPAGQATAFLLNSHKNMVRTSFVDKKFSKNLESCLRFGSPLLIEDGEQIDPLVLPVLTRDFRKAGGRTLMDLKHNEIDVSPAFQLFIVTRDTDFAPNPSISSMTVLVNFSVTSLSLRAQCLTRLLKFKLPDVEKRRRELHESLANMQVELREHEEKMLNVFSTTKGEILENDSLLHLLEEIKTESIDIEKKASETRQTLQEITVTSEQFSPVADIATNLYFALRHMSVVHFLYQFSLQFFWSVFDRIVAQDATADALVGLITKEVFTAVSYSLLHKDLPVLGFRFGQILLDHMGVTIEDSLFDLALRGSTVRGSEPNFMRIAKDKEFSEWINSSMPESDIPENVKSELGNQEAVTALKVIALMRRARPDRIVAAARLFVKSAMQYNIEDIPPLDLISIAKETEPTVPLLLVASVGHDPSDRVESVALRPIESLAVGAADSYGMIEQTVQTAAARGNWVIIKNVHLAPLWTRNFVKTLQNLRANPEFRIFMTSEINPKVGSSVFRSCRVIVFESATGVRANLRRAYTNGFQWPSIPQERRKLVMNFLWLHAAAMERLRFEPLGWAKKYEFNDADLKFASQIGIRWLEQAASGRSHLPEEQFPWTAIRYLISNCVYGGRVDIPSDQRVLKAMAELMFSPGAVIGEGLINVPEINGLSEFKEWVDNLPSDESPELIWLPKTSGKFLFIQQGNETLQHILTVSAGSTSGRSESKRSSFVQMLLEQWREKLSTLEVVDFKAANDDLISTVISDEALSIKKTRQTILSDIQDILVAMSEGDAMTQKNAKIIENLEKALVPDTWNKHRFVSGDLNIWIDDFCARISHINNAAQDSNLGRGQMNFGLLRSPESLLAASKQTAANANKWPVEKLKMRVKVGDKNITNSYDIVATDIMTLCAEWGDQNASFVVTDEVTGKLPPMLISWSLEEDPNGIIVPCFMTISKKRPVFDCVLPVSDDKSKLWWTVRNPSLVLQPKAL